MPIKRRFYHPSKAAWAASEAARCRAEAAALEGDSHPSSAWHHVRRKMDRLRELAAEERRFERLAERFRAAGQ